MISLAVIKILGFAVLLMTLIVGLRFLTCLVASLRARRYLIFVFSTLGFVGIMGAFGMVVIAWFAYAVAHIGKDARTDLMVLLFTVPPFFVVSIVLWLLCGNLRARLQRTAARPDAHGDPDSTAP